MPGGMAPLITFNTALFANTIAVDGTVVDKGTFGSGRFGMSFLEAVNYFSKAILSTLQLHCGRENVA